MIRPRKPKGKTILKIGAVLAIVGFILFIRANVRPVPVRVQITLTRLTNQNWYYTRDGEYVTTGTSQITLAYFCVSNAEKFSVLSEGYYRYEYDTKGNPSGAVDEPRKTRLHLKPGEFQMMCIRAPENNTNSWRVHLSFSKLDWRYRLYEKDIIPYWWLKSVWLKSREEAVPSDWINGSLASDTVTNPPSLP